MADAAAEADAFLASMQAQINAEVPQPEAQPAAPAYAMEDVLARAQAAAASLNDQYAQQEAQFAGQTNGYAPAPEVLPGPPSNVPPPQQAAAAAVTPGQEEGGAEGRRKRRNRWGNPSGPEQPAAEAPGAAPAAPPEEAAQGTAKKKRRSRWEEPEESTDLSLANNVPKELVLGGGIKVSCLASLPRLPLAG